MVGCRFDAKNTLDRNYLYLAELAGATVHPDTEAVDVAPLPGGGYEVMTERPGAWIRKRRRKFRADQVVFSAGALGTTRLLLGLKEQSLPNLSDKVGWLVRTNSEALLGATARQLDTDYSTGVAITSSIHPKPDTHMEPVRYPPGSNAMGLLATVLVDGGARIPRQLRFLGQVVRHPITFARSLSVRRWSERTVILLVMQSLDNSIRLTLRRSRLGKRLRSHQDDQNPNPTYIPIANEAARVAAGAIDGFPSSAVNEVLLDVPTTAHIIGGAPMGETDASGAIDAYHRVHGHDGLHVIDGAAVPANLGVNPALTITAMAERAVAFWPNKGESDPRPAVGAAYERIPPVAPLRPVVPRDAPGALRIQT